MVRTGVRAQTGRHPDGEEHDVDAQQERLYEAREGIDRTLQRLETIEQAQAAALTDLAGVKADAARSTEALTRLGDPTRLGRRLGLDL